MVIGVFFPLLLLSSSMDTTQMIKEIKWAKRFGMAGLGFSLLAIASDVEADLYYQKYQDATVPDSCVYYRKKTILFENLRDGFLGAGLLNFTVASILAYFEKKDGKYRLNLRFNRGGMSLTLIRKL